MSNKYVHHHTTHERDSLQVYHFSIAQIVQYAWLDDEIKQIWYEICFKEKQKKKKTSHLSEEDFCALRR